MERYTSNQAKLLLSTILCFLSCTFISAQEENYFTISLDLLTDLSSTSNPNQYSSDNVSKEIFFTVSALDDDLTSKGVDNEEGVPSYFRQHKIMPVNFSGFVIELLQSEEKLERNYPLFKRFGNVHVQQLENGKFSYCIIANFNKAKSLKIFVEDIIVPLAPEAQAFKYKKGKRKKM